MITLIREKSTGDYYTEDGQYQIQKGIFGWNVKSGTDVAGTDIAFPVKH